MAPRNFKENMLLFLSGYLYFGTRDHRRSEVTYKLENGSAPSSTIGLSLIFYFGNRKIDLFFTQPTLQHRFVVAGTQ